MSIAVSASTVLATPPALVVRMLPDGPTGTGSRAACAAVWDDTDITSVIIGGQLRDNGGVWRAAVWLQTGRVISPPVVFPDAGNGGAVSGVAVSAVTDGTSNSIMFAGSVSTLMGLLLPAVWAAKGGGEVAMEELSLVMLSTPANYGGEALGVTVATGDFNGDGVVDGADFLAWGRVIAPDGRQFAAVWVSGMNGNDTLTLLPPLVVGGESGATGLAITLTNTMISGYANNAAGRPQAVIWEWSDGEWQAPVRLGNLTGGNRSLARTETVDNNETITVAGQARSAQGLDLPALWRDTNHDGTFEVQALSGAPGFNTGGRVNSIIAILIGLFTAGRVDGAQGSHACIWINQEEIPAACIDLNAIARNVPAGVTLTEANCILPYIEQSNFFACGVAGNAADAAGNPRGWIGTYARFVPDMDSDQSGIAFAHDGP